MSKVAAIIGAGPGIGRAVALKFAKEGYSVALIARTPEKLQLIEKEILEAKGKALSIAADATNETQVASAFNEIRNKLGHPEVLIFNAGTFSMGSALDLKASDVENAWKIGCLGALLASQQVLPKMIEQKRGTIIFGGATASIRGSAKFASLAITKFGLRALSQSLAREFGPQGIHVSHVILDGRVGGSDAPEVIQPEKVAEVYWNLHTQDKSTWTQELDIRPYSEKF